MAFKKFYAKEGAYVPPEDLFDWVREHPMHDGRLVPTLIWGSKGIGKTQQIKAYCDKRNLEMQSYHPAHDVNGQDILGETKLDPETGKLVFSLPEWLPTETAPGKDGGVWFIDEINRAQEAVLAGLMEPLGEGTISQSNWVLPDGWMIIAAANPTETGYMVAEIDEALVDRTLHYSPGWEAPVWGHWASQAGINSDIINFAFQAREEIPASSSLGQSQLPHEIEGKLTATPRSLTYFDALYDPGMDEALMKVVAQGLLGKSAGDKFVELAKAADKPLLGKEILADPIENSAGKKEYLYDDKINLWKSNQGSYSNHLFASAQHLTVELLDIGEYTVDGVSYHNDVKKNIPAQRAGRFLELLPSRTKDQAYEVIVRSAPKWAEIVAEAMRMWTPVLARTGMILGAPSLAVSHVDETLNQIASSSPQGDNIFSSPPELPGSTK